MRIKSFLFALVSLAGLLLSNPLLASPDIEHWSTHNGARVYYVHAPELPIMDLHLVFDAGAARDDDDPGLAIMTNGMLAEGAGGQSADQLAEQFESIGAQFSNSSQRDMAVLSHQFSTRSGC